MENKIKLAMELHTISDEYAGVSYNVDKSFKEAKSHAAEVNLLCTYAPNDEYGSEADMPYIAVQEDDDVFCAIDDFKIKGTFEKAIEITALKGQYLFKAKMEYYGDMMYFYGFEKEDVYFTQAGLCMVYPKEYVGTEDEKILMKVLDEAAESFRNI